MTPLLRERAPPPRPVAAHCSVNFPAASVHVPAQTSGATTVDYGESAPANARFGSSQSHERNYILTTIRRGRAATSGRVVQSAAVDSARYRCASAVENYNFLTLCRGQWRVVRERGGSRDATFSCQSTTCCPINRDSPRGAWVRFIGLLLRMSQRLVLKTIC